MFIAKKEYDNKFLEPFISEETQDYHFGKHHTGYANVLNSLVSGTQLKRYSIAELINQRSEIDQKIYNNASQVFNHDFYWNSITSREMKPSDKVQVMIEKSFGGLDSFKKSYVNKACEMFGSGWSWLVTDGNSLFFLNTQNSDTPMEQGFTPVLVLDLWEHAYYIDYRNDRKSYIEQLVNNCLDWEFAETAL